MDKSALGWDHVEKVDKHESQIGTLLHVGSRVAPFSKGNLHDIYLTLFSTRYFIITFQIIHPALEESLEFKMIVKISLP